jgi:hypothetical protein
MTSAEAADVVAITAEAINKEESDFMKRLLKGDRERKGCKRGTLIASKMHHICDGSHNCVCVNR